MQARLWDSTTLRGPLFSKGFPVGKPPASPGKEGPPGSLVLAEALTTPGHSAPAAAHPSVSPSGCRRWLMYSGPAQNKVLTQTWPETGPSGPSAPAPDVPRSSLGSGRWDSRPQCSLRVGSTSVRVLSALTPQEWGTVGTNTWGPPCM